MLLMCRLQIKTSPRAVKRYTQNSKLRTKLAKNMNKYLVFLSISVSLGRLFQTLRPAKENACFPNLVDGRGLMYMVVDAERKPSRC